MKLQDARERLVLLPDFRAFTGAVSLKQEVPDYLNDLNANFRAFTGAVSLKLSRVRGEDRGEEEFPRLHRRGLIEAGRQRGRCLSTLSDFRAFTGAVSLKLARERQRVEPLKHFRAFTGAVSLKADHGPPVASWFGDFRGGGGDALANPAWGVWFGRKACLPALPLSPMVATTPVEALAALLDRLAVWEGREAPDPATLESWEEPETTDPAEGDFFLHDAPLSFGERTFAARPVRHRRATSGSRQSAAPDATPNDFFESL